MLKYYCILGKGSGLMNNTLEYLNNGDSRKILVIGTERTIEFHICIGLMKVGAH